MEQTIDFLTLFDLCPVDQTSLLNQISDYLENEGYVHSSFRQALFERERIFPTGLPSTSYGVAIPHVDVEHVKRSAVLTVTLQNPVVFELMGGPKGEQVSVECLFVILLCERSDHMKLLVRFIRVIQNPEDLSSIRYSHSQQQVREILNKYINA